MKQRQTTVLLVALAVLLLASSVASAFVPYRNYTYDIWRTPIKAPAAYAPSQVLYGDDFGVGALNNPQDIHVSYDGDIFIVDTGNNRIIQLDAQWQLTQIIEAFENDGVTDGFRNPGGVFVTRNGNLFVADTANARVVELDSHGNLVRILESPESDIPGLLPDNFVFRPRKLVVDRANRIYIVSRDMYEGLIVLYGTGELMGFIGAPRVAPTIADLFWSRIATDAQRERQSIFLPTEFSNLALDDMGFILTIVAGAAEEETIKRLNLSGQDVIRRLGYYDARGDLVFPWHQWASSVYGPSVFVDIIGREAGMYSVLDGKRGRIFTYDSRGYLLYIFGGPGRQEGTLQVPVAIESIDGTILVLDSGKRRVTVFEPTEYAQAIHDALIHYDAGRYDQSADSWRRVLGYNNYFYMAHTGIGRAQLRDGLYEEAMISFYRGHDRPNYSDAFTRYRRQRLLDNFGLMVFAIAAVVVAGFLIRYWIAKRNKEQAEAQVSAAADTNTNSVSRFFVDLGGKLWYSTHVIFHPFDGFWDLKYEKRGSNLSASVIVVVLTLTFVAIRQYTAFLFNPVDTTRINLVVEALSVLVPFFLWVVLNWAVTTLMDGKGTLSDIYIVSAYSFVPVIIFGIPATILSHYLTFEEGTFFYLLQSVGVIWSILLLFLASMITHEYDFSKTALSAVIIIASIGFVLFTVLIFFNVVDEIFSFVTTVYREIALRALRGL